MLEFLQTILATLSRLDVRSLVDILIVSVIAYWLLGMIQGTTAVTLVRGMAILLLAGAVLGNVLRLTMLSWLLRNSIPALLVAIPILFQPEIRRALEQLGRAGRIWPQAVGQATATKVVQTVASASGKLAERRWGALLILERETGLAEYARSGVQIDALLSEELLLNIFYPNNPLHDGAVVIRGDRVLAARCTLPLADTAPAESNSGMRHRAGLAITQQTDALSVVVSEQTGHIAFCNRGRFVHDLNEEKLRKILAIQYKVAVSEAIPSWLRGRVSSGKASTRM